MCLGREMVGGFETYRRIVCVKTGSRAGFLVSWCLVNSFERQQDARKQKHFWIFKKMAKNIIKKVLNRKGTLGGKSVWRGEIGKWGI